MHPERKEGEENTGWTRDSGRRITSSLTQEETVRRVLVTE